MKKAWKEFIRDEYHPYEIAPLWKGFVNYDIVTDKTRVAPIPFNIIYGGLYGLWRWARRCNWEAQKWREGQYILVGLPKRDKTIKSRELADIKRLIIACKSGIDNDWSWQEQDTISTLDEIIQICERK